MKDKEIHDSFENATAWYIAQQMHKEVSITGGEPLLALPRLVMFTQIIKYFNPDVKLWLYTNGRLLTQNTLQVLKAIGIDGLNVSLHKGLHCTWMDDMRWASLMFPMRYLVSEEELSHYGKNAVMSLPALEVRVWKMDDCKDMPFESRYRLKDVSMKWS
jgi:MoaA/NifB/PqqE/SkfB family radical SAM enzyme